VIAEVGVVGISLVATLGLWGLWRGGLADHVHPTSNLAFTYVHAPMSSGVTLLLSVGLLSEREWIPEPLLGVAVAVIGGSTLLGLVYALVTLLTRWERLLPRWHRDRLRGLEEATLVWATPVGRWAPPPGGRPAATDPGEATDPGAVGPGGPGSRPPGYGALRSAATELAAIEHGRQLRAARRARRAARRRSRDR
jgi:hypothetical protein